MQQQPKLKIDQDTGALDLIRGIFEALKRGALGPYHAQIKAEALEVVRALDDAELAGVALPPALIADQVSDLIVLSMCTAGYWPSAAELAQREAIEGALARGGVTLDGHDAGSGSMAIMVRVPHEATLRRAEQMAEPASAQGNG